MPGVTGVTMTVSLVTALIIAMALRWGMTPMALRRRVVLLVTTVSSVMS